MILGALFLAKQQNNNQSETAIISDAALSLTPTQTPFPSFEITWTGKIFAYMTYGRQLFENLDPNAKYKYLIAEPDDESITKDIRYTDIVKIEGTTTEHCYWNDIENTDYQGCVPWVSVKTIKKVGTDKNAKPPIMTCLASGICLSNE